MTGNESAENGSDPVIVLDDVSFGYGDASGEASLFHISLRLYRGHTYVLTGPNGCGKSTLMRILSGLSFPSSGRYLFEGEEVTEERMKDRIWSRNFYRKIGLLFQNPETQLFCKSVREEVAFGLLQLGLSREEAAGRCDRYLEMLQISHLAERAPFHLSAGEKKRTALAAVLAMQPDTLFLDEPEAGLDEEGEEWITRFLKKLGGGSRLLVVATHSRQLEETLQGIPLRMTKEHTVRSQDMVPGL